MNFLYRLRPLLLAVGLHTIPFGMVYGYTVSNLKSSLHNGQIFFTWTCPPKTNLQYNLYRSSTQITKTSQLTSSNFIGFVRDSSAENIRKARLEDDDYYFLIPGNSSPLTSTQGLYVLTCTDTKKYWYVITVTDLSKGTEDKTLNNGNTLKSTISGSLDKPQPVLQVIDMQKNGDSILEYVIWGDNQASSVWPTCNNLGSYAYNFTIQRQGKCTGQPLYVEFEDTNPFTVVSGFSADLNVLQLDDWIPNGENTYWIGYNQGYNMYISSMANPTFTTGIVKTYTMQRVIETIRFAKRLPRVDSTRIYMNGASHNGFGCMLIASIIPDEIACVYPTVPPILIKAESGTTRVHQWCTPSADLPTDLDYAGTQNAILMWDLCDLRTWFDAMDHLSGVPYMQAISGKKDVTVGWIQSYHWYDTVNRSEQGGTWYWDQRDHNGDNSKFTNDETMPNYERYLTTRSFPAFSYCSINQNPGDGDPNDGDKYGAINGYLDWYDSTIQDISCKWNITCYVKTFYAGGVADKKQYDSCTTNITLRRTQNFHPVAGQTLKWSVYNNKEKKIQSGSFVYDGDLVTLNGIKIYNTGSSIQVKIQNCSSPRQEISGVVPNQDAVQVYRSGSGYKVQMMVPRAQEALIRIYNENGQLVQNRKLNLLQGENLFDVNQSTGFYVLQIQSADLQYGSKLIF